MPRLCHFCHGPAAYARVALYNDVPPDAVDVADRERHPERGLPLCTRCLAALRAGGYDGRVHTATGLRWWYFEFAPQLNHPARLPWVQRPAPGQP
jgi:hypothetical protein